METIEDIVKEMRDLGRLDEKSTDRIPRSLQALGLRTYADRIEKAAGATERGKMYDELRKICFGEVPFINCRICQGAKLGNCKSCSLGGARSILAEASDMQGSDGE